MIEVESSVKNGVKYLIRRNSCGDILYLGAYGVDGILLWQPYNQHAICFNEYHTACAFLGGYMLKVVDENDLGSMPEVVSSEDVEEFSAS